MQNFKEPIGIHTELNPSLWDGEEIRPQVQAALLRIAKEFYKFLEVNVPVVDIVISGSQANYNYSPHSDLDLHLVIPFNTIQCDEPIDALFDTKRKLWKEQHNIDVYGIPVELYVEDEEKPAISSSYSLLHNKWVDHPDTPKIDYNKDLVERKVRVWARLISIAVKSKKVKQCKRVLALLMQYRKLGLAQYGEFGIPNLVYKSLRNADILDNLHKVIRQLEDKLLSLD